MIFRAVEAKDGAIKAVSAFIRMICMNKRLSLCMLKVLHFSSLRKTLQRTCICAASLQHWSMFLTVPDALRKERTSPQVCLNPANDMISRESEIKWVARGR
jgi:hypothetical protein